MNAVPCEKLGAHLVAQYPDPPIAALCHWCRSHADLKLVGERFVCRTCLFLGEKLASRRVKLSRGAPIVGLAKISQPTTAYPGL